MTRPVGRGGLRTEGLDLAWRYMVALDDWRANLYDALQDVRLMPADDPGDQRRRLRLLSELSAFLGCALSLAGALYENPDVKDTELRRYVRAIERDGLPHPRSSKGATR